MNLRSLIYPILLVLPQSSWSAITVNGISDEEVEANEVNFSIPSEAGFTIEATLNDSPVALDTNIEITTPGYYELDLTKTNDSDLTEESETIQFIVRDSSRGNSEWGLINWTPYPTLDSAPGAFSNANLEFITPRNLPQGFPVPMIARVTDANSGKSLRLNATLSILESPDQPIRILRGFGSRLHTAPDTSGPITLSPNYHGLSSTRDLFIDPVTIWTEISSDITSTVDYGAGARLSITSNITVADGATLTIGPGSIIQIAPGVDIEVDGILSIRATTESPAFFTNIPGQSPWGGFFLRGANSQANVTGAIFTGSGADTNWFSGSGYSSHRKEQATFLFDAGTQGSFTDCFFIDVPGQALHGKDATIAITNCLIQRLPTVGQFNGGAVTVNGSAFIEFPDHSNVFSDDDNDGIYFTAGTHQLIDTLIGWARDDGVDAGSGNSGSVDVDGCWFEACFHEGMAWSGQGRSITVKNTVAMNCGQGIEAGWSGAADNGSPVVDVTNSLTVGNHIGLRFGDNYTWDYDGELNVSDSLSLFNDRNIWGMEWDSWTYRLDKMTIENNKLTTPDPLHPANTVWNGAVDSALLEPFVPTPASDAGSGFGEWEFQKSMSSYSEGVTLSLSEFNTQTVSLDYEVVSDNLVVETGTVEFLPGELRKKITLPTLANPARKFALVSLTGSTASTITEPNTLFFLPDSIATSEPQTLIAAESDWRYLDDGSDQGTAWQALSFDDSEWPTGAGQLGYGDGDENQVIRDERTDGTAIATTYFRHTFNVTNPGRFNSLTVRLVRDDGAIVYLNGDEEFRSNIDDGPIAFDDFTGNVVSSENDYVEYTIPASDLQAGDNIIAVEIHQASSTSSDVSFDLELIANPVQPVTFFLHENEDDLILLWEGDDDLMLQSSPNLDPDSWIDHTEATSPFTIPLLSGEPQRFYRLAR